MSKNTTASRLLVAALALLVCWLPVQAFGRTSLEPLDILTPKGHVRLQVEFVATEKARERGLMNRKILAPDRGMLFDFKREQPVAFWMKNTLIPLDMIFIRADGRVNSIARNAVPGDLTPIPSGGPVRAVLEIPGGQAAKIGIEPGDRVLHRIFPRE